MALRREALCPHCNAICLCEWRFRISPYMSVDHAGWFCLGCLKRIETTSMGQHFLKNTTVYTSVEKLGSVIESHNPYRTKDYGGFVAHRIVGMPEEVVVLDGKYLVGDDDLIDAVVTLKSNDTQSSPYVSCTKCGCSMPDRHQSESEAIKTWNMRVEDYGIEV